MIALVSFAMIAAEGGHGTDWVAIAAKAVNIAVFIGILAYILGKPLAAFFNSRSTKITEDLNRAKTERAAAEAKLAEVNSRLSKLSDEKEQIRRDAEAEAEAEASRLATRTQEDVRRVSEAAEREIAGALKSARADLQAFAAEKAVELAEVQIRAQMNDEDRHRITEKYTSQIRGVAK